MTMMNQFVTLPRSVVEQALEAFEHLVRRHYRLGTEHDSRAKALRASLLDRPQVDQPAMTTIAQRKLDDLLLRGYTISGYSVYNNTKHQHGFVTGAGLVGWWKPDGVEYPQPQGEQEPYVWYDIDTGDTWTVGAIADGCSAPDGIIPLYNNPQPPRRPLTDQQINDHRLALAYDSEDLPDPWDFKQGVRAAERAHGIGGEK